MTANRNARRDVLPEHHSYRIDDCKYCSDPFSCPYPDCLDVEPKLFNRL